MPWRYSSGCAEIQSINAVIDNGERFMRAAWEFIGAGGDGDGA